MKKYIYNNVQVLIAAALTLSGAFSSCRDHDFDFDEHRYGTQEQIYNKTFTDTFGEIDPEHTWIPFVDAKVTVSVSQPSDIKVFDCNGQLVAHREDVSGTQTIEFDVPRGENNIIVLQNDIYAVEAMVGESVSFEGTRAQRYPSKDGVTINYPDEYRTDIVVKSDINYIRGTLLPNNSDNRNKAGLTKDFSFVSNGGTFTIYPVYWNTGATLECGIYYKDSKGDLVHVPFYMNKGDNDRLQGKYNNQWYDIKTGNNDTYYYNGSSKYTDFQTRGIEVSLEEGVAFGLYISQNGKYFHSKKEDNECGHVHAVQFEYDGKEYFSFEDWDNEKGHFWNKYYELSLNDIIFTIENKPRVLDYGAVGFTMAFEDMGSIGDFDFNDVVLQVEREEGQRYGTLTLAAAGATYYIEVLYDGDPIDWGGDAKEVHAAFGVDRKTMVNTGKGEYLQPKVRENFDFGNTSITRSDIANNFSLRVYTGDPDTQDYNIIQIPNTTEGVAPQGFVVNNVRWSWPNERQSILDKYPAFLNWVQNQQNTHWFEPESNSQFEGN